MPAVADTARSLPDLVAANFATPPTLDWGDTFQAIGTIRIREGRRPESRSTSRSCRDRRDHPSTSAHPRRLHHPGRPGTDQTANFNQNFSLPATAIPNYSSSNPIYIDLFINPNKAVTESNYKNNEGVGQGYDSSPITIVPEEPSLLIGSSFSINPTSTTWGQTITVTAQIRNNAQGDVAGEPSQDRPHPVGPRPGQPVRFHGRLSQRPGHPRLADGQRPAADHAPGNGPLIAQRRHPVHALDGAGRRLRDRPDLPPRRRPGSRARRDPDHHRRHHDELSPPRRRPRPCPTWPLPTSW